MKIIIITLLFCSTINIVAQVKITNPVVTTTNADKIIKAEKLLKAEAEKKAAISKILNATLVDLKFSIYNDNPHNGWFDKKTISLNGNGICKFKVPNFLLENNSTYKITEDGKDTWTFTTAYGGTGKAGNGRLTGDTYKSLLENGFNIKINFTDRKDRIFESEFTTNFSVTFIFSDGNEVIVPLQGITLVGNKGSFKATSKRPFILDKNYGGNEFPDPNNPIVIPIVK